MTAVHCNKTHEEIAGSASRLSINIEVYIGIGYEWNWVDERDLCHIV